MSGTGVVQDQRHELKDHIASPALGNAGVLFGGGGRGGDGGNGGNRTIAGAGGAGGAGARLLGEDGLDGVQ